MNTASAAAVYMLMFNIIEENKNPKEKCVGGGRNCIVSDTFLRSCQLCSHSGNSQQF
jgi:hypothetical protein